MFGTDAASEVIYRVLSGVPELTALVDDRIVGLPVLPQDVQLPVAMFAPVAGLANGSYGDLAIGGPIAMERIDFAVRLICAGRSTEPLLAAAMAQLQALHGHREGVTLAGVPHVVTISATGELTSTTVIEGDTFHRQLGNTYRVEIA